MTETPGNSAPRCLSCGYDLAGLPESGRCPECATPVERSRRGNLLRFASPAYLKTLRTGATLALVASLLYIFEWIPRIAISAILFSLGIGISNALETAINISALATMLFGWWMLSTPDPAFIGMDDSRDWRVRLRWILPLASLVIVCNEGSRFIFAGSLARSVTFGAGAAQLSLTYSEMLVWVSRLAHASVIYCGLNYIRVLAFRVPSISLRKSASDASASMGVIIGLLLLIIVFGIAGKFEGLFTAIALICALSAMIALLVWLVQYFGVLGRLRAELSRSINAAHAIARYESARDQAPPASHVSTDAADATDSIHPPPITQSGSDAS